MIHRFHPGACNILCYVNTEQHKVFVFFLFLFSIFCFLFSNPQFDNIKGVSSFKTKFDRSKVVPDFYLRTERISFKNIEAKFITLPYLSSV